MRSLQSATLQAFNSLLAEQKHLNPDATRPTLMFFNHKSETVVDNTPWQAFPICPQPHTNPKANGAYGWHR